VVAVPPLPAAARSGGTWAEPVSAALAAAATPDARRAAALGAVRAFQADFGALLDASAAQAEAVAALREAATALVAAETATWRGVLETGRFFELERVYREVLAELRVPVVDEVYSAVGRFWHGVRRLLPGHVEDPFARRIAERRAQERDGAKAAAHRAFDAREGLPDRQRAVLGDAARALVPPAPPADALSRAVDAFLDAEDRAADAWVAERRAEALARLRGHPARTAALRALRAVLQLGPGVLAALVTGGLGAGLASFVVTERLASTVFDVVGTRAAMQSARQAYLERRVAAFQRFLTEQVAAPVGAGAPPLPTAAELAAARAALAALEAR
jgi:hypothetical protein